MSEETPPAKKSARKSVRKKSASKRVSRKSTQSETSTSEEQLPLDEVKPASETSSPESDAAPVKKGREPKSGVRDARRETADEPVMNEVSEKLVDSDSDSAPREERKQRSGDQQREQNRSEQNEGRGRGRNRGRDRGRGQERDQRPEKREPKARVPIDAKDMSKKAWKIFESEVTEEGLALLDDNGLRDYARSSFNAARIFLEEEGRVSGRQEKPKKQKKEKDQDED